MFLALTREHRSYQFMFLFYNQNQTYFLLFTAHDHKPSRVKSSVMERISAINTNGNGESKLGTEVRHEEVQSSGNFFVAMEANAVG